MQSLLGWTASLGTNDVASIQAKMLRTVSAGAEHKLLTPAPASAREKEDGLVCALIGQPRWTEQSLAGYATQHGHDATLARAWRQYGEDFLRHLTGHFAAAVLDQQGDSALLAIDRIGVHGLYYAQTANGDLVFGSSANMVRAHPEVDASLSHQALFDYLFFHMVPSPGTVYTGIRKLEPAQLLRWEKGKVEFRHYWQPDFVEHGSHGFDTLKNEFLQTLRTSVQACDTEGAAGAFLSGGTDSSTVSGMLAGLQKHPAKTYSIGFSQEGYDEISYARIASRHFGTEQHEYYVTTDDVAEAFPLVAKAYDEPFGNSSAIPTLFCARLASRDGTQVLLAGDGGDELFGGNARYAKQKVFNYYQGIPQWLRSALLEPLLVDLPFAQHLPVARKARSYIEQARIPMPDRTESYNFLRRDDPRRIFTPEFLARINPEHPFELLRDTWNRAPTDNLLNRMLFLDWKFTLADNDLRKVNSMCALGGVQVRYPMLDDGVVAFSARVPPDLKLKGQKLRWFFKEALRDFLPQEIITKSKHGFGLPFGEWLKGSPALQEVVYSSLENLKGRGIVRAEFIHELVTTHREGHAAYYGTMIWVLAILEQWFQQHKVNP